MERIKARRLLLPALAHNDAPTVLDAAATRDSTGARAAAQKRVDTMSTGVQVYWCPRSSSAFARDHELSQHVEEVLTSCAVGSVGARERHGSGAGADVAAVTVSAANWMTSQSMIGTQESHEGMRWQRALAYRASDQEEQSATELLDHDLFPNDRLAPSLVPSDHVMGCHTGKRERDTPTTTQAAAPAPAGQVHVDNDRAVWSRKP